MSNTNNNRQSTVNGRISAEEISSCLTALYDMLQNRQKLEIKELTSRSGIDRTTFYRNFRSIDGFLGRIENDLAARLERAFKIIRIQNSYTQSNTHNILSYSHIAETMDILSKAPAHLCDIVLYAHDHSIWQRILEPFRSVIVEDNTRDTEDAWCFLFDILCDVFDHVLRLWQLNDYNPNQISDLSNLILLHYRSEKVTLNSTSAIAWIKGYSATRQTSNQ